MSDEFWKAMRKQRQKYVEDNASPLVPASDLTALREAGEQLADAIDALRNNISISRGSREPMEARGAWFRGLDAVAQCDAIDEALAAWRKAVENE